MANIFGKKQKSSVKQEELLLNLNKRVELLYSENPGLVEVSGMGVGLLSAIKGGLRLGDGTKVLDKSCKGATDEDILSAIEFVSKKLENSYSKAKSLLNEIDKKIESGEGVDKFVAFLCVKISSYFKKDGHYTDEIEKNPFLILKH